MILAPLVAVTLVISASASSGFDTDTAEIQVSQMTTQQKVAAMQPLMRSATACIAQAVAHDPRFGTADLGDLIVNSMRPCLIPVRAMIERYDRYFGDGAGEAFFTGPYLDELPAVVTDWVRKISD